MDQSYPGARCAYSAVVMMTKVDMNKHALLIILLISMIACTPSPDDELSQEYDIEAIADPCFEDPQALECADIELDCSLMPDSAQCQPIDPCSGEEDAPECQLDTPCDPDEETC